MNNPRPGLYRIYTRRLASQLRAKGFELVGIDVDYKHIGYDNYLFYDSQELREEVKKLIYKSK